jgi:hypothetical protein
VVLWFEHDSHDQLILARILAQLAKGRVPACLELICIDNHPEAKPRFNGLGQLSPEALAGLWPFRKPVTDDQISLGKSIWRALRDPDPTRLQSIAETSTPALPIASRALWRHLEELPATVDGLSLTQRLILTILAENGPMPVGKLFAAMVHDREPLVFMGDLSFLLTMEAMAGTTPRVLTIEEGEKPLLRAATITDTGREVLAGRRDYLTLGPAERWVGGVLVQGGVHGWRFDGMQRRVTVA